MDKKFLVFSFGSEDLTQVNLGMVLLADNGTYSG